MFIFDINFSKMKKFSVLYLVFFTLLANSCNKADQEDEYYDGLKPVYSQEGFSETVSSEAPGQITKGNKIYIKGNYVYIVESGLGVHVIDNSNPSTPNDIRFLKIDGVGDIAIRNNIMYANQKKDIIAIDIQDVMNVNVTERLEDVYNLNLDQFPLAYSGYFECIDETKGTVLAWEEAYLKNPKCRK